MVVDSCENGRKERKEEGRKNGMDGGDEWKGKK